MSDIGETRFIEPLVRADVFCIDDLGKRASAIYWPLLFLIADRRNKREKPMLITAQFPPEELTKRAPAAFKPDAIALIRRFTESCKIIHFEHK
jgi:DNA replication protein DnaC